MPFSRRHAVGVSAVALVVLLAGLAFALQHAQSRAKADNDKRFHDRTAIAAALVDSQFASATGQMVEGATAAVSAPSVDPRALDKVRAEGLTSVIVLDAAG